MHTHGFTLVREETLSEAGGPVRLWKHEKTGAELLSAINADENKCFGVSFRTPPRDSSGVAHILEHSVLCGSRKYPVKEPFVELLKSSLQTFLNALTFPDKTCYPVASANLQDFYNLTDVYLDAVFHPRIDEDVLRQEGWHISVDEGGSWSYKGVVFNEMKGVYSSPDSLLMEQAQQSLFPDTLYSLDSGGDPAEIPKLGYEQFRAFHRDYYHPSNARFFFWGDDPEDARLEKLDAVLAPFARSGTDSAVPLQPRLALRRTVRVPFQASGTDTDAGPDYDADAGSDLGEHAGTYDADDAGELVAGEPSVPSGDSGEPRGHVAVNWLLCESADVEELFILEMLEHILTGLPGSPLRKALMDSGLGEDLTGAGLETDLRQAFFSVGLRSIRPEDAGKVEALILDALTALAEEGVADKAVEAAMNSLEFELRENNTGRFPRGLAALFRSLSTWLYDGDPFAPLAWEKPLASIKARLAAGEALFVSAIRRWLLDNAHRTTVLLTPDAGLAARLQAREDEMLAARKAAMTPAEQRETAAVSERLRLAQERADDPEALASIPSLGIEDVPATNAILPCKAEDGAWPRYITHELDTTGVLYAKLLFPLHADLPRRLLPLVPLYARALTEMGTLRRDYVDLGLELAAKTGGLDAFFSLHTRLDDAAPMPFLEVCGKATADKCGQLTALIREILTRPRFDDRERFTQMVLEEKARLEQSVIPAGHALVSVRLGGRLSASGRLAELTNGVTYLEYIRELSARLDKDWPLILADLHTLGSALLRRAGLVVSLTADGNNLTKALPLFRELDQALPDARHDAGTADWTDCPDPSSMPSGLAGAEILLTPSQVNYVGLGMDLRAAGYRYHGSAQVIMRHLRMGYLWDRVRVQGGAYGIFASLSRATGSLLFLSYRDPGVERTLEVYRQAADYLGNLSLSKEDVTRAVVGAIGDLDAYLLPGAKGATALWRHLARDTESERQRIREEILSTGIHDFHDFAPCLAGALRAATPCVLGGAAAESAGRAADWTINKIL